MADYVSSALFIYSKEGYEFASRITENSHGVKITPVPIETLLDSEKEYLQNRQHVVVCGSLNIIKKVMRLAMEYQFSLGFIPLSSQPSLIEVTVCQGILRRQSLLPCVVIPEPLI